MFVLASYIDHIFCNKSFGASLHWVSASQSPAPLRTGFTHVPTSMHSIPKEILTQQIYNRNNDIYFLKTIIFFISIFYANKITL